jgi:hypothetical protein
VSASLPEKILQQIRKAGLPTAGRHPFNPQLTRNRSGDPVIEKQAVAKGPKRGKRGYVDDQRRIWVKDRGHAGLPDHWDVQIDGGEDYLRVGLDGNELS